MKRFATVMMVLVLASVAGQANAELWHQETFEEFNVGDGRAELVAAGWTVPNPSNHPPGSNDSVKVVAMNAPGGAPGTKALEMGWSDLNKRVAAELEHATANEQMSAWFYTSEMGGSSRTVYAADLIDRATGHDPGLSYDLVAYAGIANRTTSTSGMNKALIDLTPRSDFETPAGRWYKVLFELDVPAGQGTVTLFDDTGTMLESPFTGDLRGETAFASLDGFHLGAYLPGHTLVVDNILFGDPIPEPATIGLLALGALGLIRRRRA